MSFAAYAEAVRDYLRANLDGFYDGEPVAVAANCKVMPDEKPAANCGQEFISIYGTHHIGRNYMQAIEEEIGIVIAVSRKIALVPPDYRGEKGVIDIYPLTIADADEEDRFLTSFKSVEARCREIVKLLAGTARYEIMQDANDNLAGGSPFTEPLTWRRTDGMAQQVSADHFYSYYEPIQDSDPIFGLVMKVYFDGAIRLQPISDLDVVE